MNSFLFIFFTTFLWIINLFNGTGLGNLYNTTEITRSLLFLIAIFLILIRLKYSRILIKNMYLFASILSMFIIFTTVSIFKGHGIVSFDYIWIFMIVFIISARAISLFDIKVVSLFIGILGGSILFLNNYTNIFSGWNGNTIGMIGLHSYLIFIIPFYRTNIIVEKIVLVTATFLYSVFVLPTDSRSSMLFAFTALLFYLIGFNVNLFFKRKILIILVMFSPIIIATIVSIVSNSSIIDDLNRWSYNTFEKPIFNGRDEIWKYGFELIYENIFFGTGKIYSGYWHNSAISCLVSFGVIGYLFWINSFYSILKVSSNYSNDAIISGCTISFLILFAQQSVELGIFGPNPNFLPYIILGLMLGRLKYLRREEFYEKNRVEYNSSCIQLRKIY